jgi:ribokinase
MNFENTPVLRSAEAQTGAALIHLSQDSHKQILVAIGVNACLTAQDVAAAAPALTVAKALLVQLEVPLGAVEAAVLLAAEAGARVVLDPAPPRQLRDELLRLVDVLKPNAQEAEALTGIAVHDRASAHRAAETLLKRGVRALALQASNEGNLLVWREGSCFLPWLPVERVDTSGAGDAFAAGLATTVLGAYPSLPRRAAVETLL